MSDEVKQVLSAEILKKLKRINRTNKNEGGGAMSKNVKKYLWSTIDANRRLIPYVILECDAETIENRKSHYEAKWKYIADRLHELYPEKFPSWFNEYGRRRLFWYNNVLEDWNEAYERLLEETMENLRDYYDDEEEVLLEAKMRVEEKLKELPIIKL
jgi:hypothetical protein